MLNKLYKVTGMNAETGRQKTVTIKVHPLDIDRLDEIMEREAKGQDIFPPYTCNEVSSNTTPSENQLNYAKDLGIQVPPDATGQDVSALISRKLEGDSSPPNPELIQFANAHRIEFSDHCGKKALYNAAWNQLGDIMRIAFFAFCVYRYYSEDRRGNLDTHPHRDTFLSFANAKISDERYMKSINGYDGEQLRFFGELTISDGNTHVSHQGGSTKTIAFAETKDHLKNFFDLKFPGQKTIHKIPGSMEGEFQTLQPHSTTAANATSSRQKDKWIAFALCLFLGCLGVHKFYEGKTGMGILYIFTAGLFGIGWIVDIIILLCKPNPYYV